MVYYISTNEQILRFCTISILFPHRRSERRVLGYSNIQLLINERSPAETKSI